ncbi:MAG: hypothetical protein D4R56_00760 [Deltaproteobacteria bacterium]|nr:MAG: hypothetical protein D4R56_00760 [Deltaproteobacteria bacterium]
MDELANHLPRPIKEVIAEFPELVAILNEYEIGCGSCMVGDCLFKDIVSIHNLPPELEKEMMARLAAAISPAGKGKLLQPAAVCPKKSQEKTYSPPIKRLVDEHLLIKKWLALIPEVVENMDVTSGEGRKVVAGGIDFISSYADQFHHAKEEAILFTYFDERAEIIRAMLSDHETGRRHVRAMREALDKEETAAIIEHLQSYGALLDAHIKKEDEILFPWMDGNLSETDKDAITEGFDKAEREMGAELPVRCASFITDLERKFTHSLK